MAEKDGDGGGDGRAAVESLQQFLDELLIYQPSTILDTAVSSHERPSPEDILRNSSQASSVLRLLRRYVRPRNEVLRIRKAVNAALRRSDVGDASTIYSEYLAAMGDLHALKAEKEALEEKLRSIKRIEDNGDDVQLSLLGDAHLQKLQRQLQVLQI